MTAYRYAIGDKVMCNLGPSGWKIGRIIALDYREPQWPAGRVAPYQVSLEADHALIYVPVDDPRYCREPTDQDLKITGRIDALAVLPAGIKASDSIDANSYSQFNCDDQNAVLGNSSYRSGRCQCCNSCPQSWLAAELYSEHYRCASRNGLKVTRRSIHLGQLRVGDTLNCTSSEPDWLAFMDSLPSKTGYLQCPTLVRLPPGLRFTDEASLIGEIRFDPHRDSQYAVEFVAVSTVDWKNPDIGLVRLEITFEVQGNEIPTDFDLNGFQRGQQEARQSAHDILRRLGNAWEHWERGTLGNRDTCERMRSLLTDLRELLEQHPRLDRGRWWAQLGGYHMNVHKLLENMLFECELYLGHALTFGDAEVRWIAEQNLDGCYKKRLLEAARFLWIEGLEQMLLGEWKFAAETFERAAAKSDGWGWAVNFGDIWFSEAATRLIYSAELATLNMPDSSTANQWLQQATQALERAVMRTEEADYFGPEGHPWGAEIQTALNEYQSLLANKAETTQWLDAFKLRTTYWCAQVLGGAHPFPPQPRERHDDAAELISRLPGHN